MPPSASASTRDSMKRSAPVTDAQTEQRSRLTATRTGTQIVLEDSALTQEVPDADDAAIKGKGGKGKGKVGGGKGSGKGCKGEKGKEVESHKGGKGGGKGKKGQSQPYSAFVAAPIGIKMAIILKETSGKGAKVEERALSIAPSIKENMEFRKIVDATFKGVPCVFFKAPM